VTTNLEKAKRFLDVMNEGHPEYGCIISKGKTMVNFEHESIEGSNITKPTQKCMIHPLSVFCCLMAW
ncbi:hypothetical protein CY34DRAFT_98308, partial [Suillus luteus UH-Slu-Lm8-n1]